MQSIDKIPIFRKVFFNSGWIAAEHILRLICGLGVTVFLARTLGPVDFGLLNYFLSVIAIMSVLSGFGIENNICNDLALDTCDLKKIMGGALFIRILGSFFFSVAFILIFKFYWSITENIKSDFLFFFLFLFLQSSDLLQYPFQAKLNISPIVKARIFSLILFSLLKIYLIFSGISLVDFFYILLYESLFNLVCILFVYNKRFDIYKISLSSKYVWNLLKRSWPLLLASISTMLYLRADMIMLGDLADKKEVGIYASATKISEAWYFIPMALMASVQPLLVKQRASGVARFLGTMRYLYALMAGMAVLIGIGTTILGPALISLLYGDLFLGSGPVLVVHIWAALAVFLGVVSSQYLIIENLQKYSAIRTGLGLVVNLGLNAIFIPSFGALGAAGATLVSYLVAVFSIGLMPSLRGQFWYMIRSLSPIEWYGALRYVLLKWQFQERTK